MPIRITVPLNGEVLVKTISALEDHWHDYLYFKVRGSELGRPSASAADHLVSKRYYRAALVTLVFYFEGVLNRWLMQILPNDEWERREKECIEKKVDLIRARMSEARPPTPDIHDAKELRNMLAHLKPGKDLEVYDNVALKLLEDTEEAITDWLSVVEGSLKLQRHSDTRLESRCFTDALGTIIPGSEGYSGDL
jgi:hypothetical protein